MSNTPENVRKKIQAAKEKKLKKLDLSNRWNASDEEKLTEIPADVFELTWLKSLDLSYSQITSVPEAITYLQNLSILDLSSNLITNLSEAIIHLKNLSTLNLSRNQITNLSEAITYLQNLSVLGLSNNQITNLPEAITRLQHLSSLNLSNNQITRLPEAITHLQNLSVLNLSNNQITNLPEAITHLQNLSVLGLSNNQITNLPEAITHLQNLSVLDLSNNQITSLPEAITRLQNLSILNLSNNPIEKPPLEVVEKGMDAIREYFRQLAEQGEDYLYEAKLLIIGEGGAGKTTLAKKIQNPDYQLQEEDTTKGIEVIQWSFPMDNGRDFQVNIWDFGGQEIYHATHQFFLTKRSLYALVADNRKEDTDFYYWLNIVELLSDNSPVLIIKNEKQDRHREINEPQLRGRFTNLKETLATNFATNRGLPEVLREIKHYMDSLPHVGTKLPKTWVRVREALDKDPRNYISLDEYLQICQENGFTHHKDKLQLSGYLHDLGVCLHFQNDPILNNIVILKPKWGTNAVYRILDNEYVIDNLGKFSWKDLQSIWHEEQYVTKQTELLQLMIKFKLCYQIPYCPGVYIAPQLLTEKQPDYPWYIGQNLILRYTYEFMPKGIITQLIVAMHELIDKQRYVWKTGAILSYKATKAEIIEYYDKREIKIRVAGKHKKELLTIASYELDKIHNSYKHLKYDKLIPCNCTRCNNNQNPHFYKFENLKTRIYNQRYEVECDISYQMVRVLSLIDDVGNLDILKDSQQGQNLYVNVTVDQNQINQKDSSMSTIHQHGLGDNYGGDRIHGDKIGTQINNSQNLAEAAKEIKELLDQLSQEYSNNVIVGAKAIEEIDKKPNLKSKAINALKEAGSEALNALINHPSASIVIAAVKGFADG